MRYAPWLLAAVLLSSSVDAARVTFERMVPSRHPIDVPTDRIALLQMDGETSECSHVFLRIAFMEAIRKTGAEIEDVSHLKSSLETRRRGVDADLYLVSEACVCRAKGTPIGDGLSWYAGACQARFRLSDREERDLGTVTVKGQSENKSDVLDFAAHITAGKAMMIDLVRMIRPHERTVVIDTDRKVPGEKEAARLLKKKDFAGARAVWERELAAQPDHAGLHFSLAAVTEALGEIETARRHYEEAVRLAPEEEKHARFKGYFEERNR